jgi:hypothetical protein
VRPAIVADELRKRDRLASAATLSRAEDRIVGWWHKAYLSKTRTRLPDQFLQEARASLPGLWTSAPRDIFASVTLQRIRLRHDQQVPEWPGGEHAPGYKDSLEGHAISQ